MSYTPLRSEPIANRKANHHQPHSSYFRKPFPGSCSEPRKLGSIENSNSNDSNEGWPIIVHSHLCWDWVWQRPQQFLSRLSARHNILFVETVGPDAGLVAPLARFCVLEDFPNITALRIQFPAWRWENARYVDAERRRLLQEFLQAPPGAQFRDAVQWFYDPMAVTAFAGQLGEILTVYDCMDELSQFRGAPPEITQREARLLMRADVVFTGGRKLFESKSRYHDNCHFYGCGVDWQHFGQAREDATTVPPQLASVPKPVLGYFGVVDERMDYELIAKLADANPNWSVAMIGPVLKVEESSLPQRPNLYWLGKQNYSDLPAFCKGFDVCMMPFALNESTEFINPTKALEYMATGRPIVSTAVPDVVRNFGSVVKIADGPDEFISHCRQALEQPDGETIEAGLKMARENSWESIVEKLEMHVSQALRKKRGNGVVA